MILPGSYIFSILVLIAVLLCWGTWSSVYKATGKWRFELFYFDFAVGAMILATICALTFGSLGWDGFSFIDDIRLAGKKQDVFALLAGAVFNLGNMLMVAAISVAGITLAVPVGAGIGLVVGGLLGLVLHHEGNPVMIAVGAAMILASAVFNALAYKASMMQKLMAQIRQGKTKSTKKVTSSKGVVVAAIGGVLLGSFYPLLERAKDPDVGLGPYSLAFVFIFGVFFTTFVYNLFFMNLPIQGQALELTEYFKGKGTQHLLGLASGGLFAAGVVAKFVSDRVAGSAGLPAPLLVYAFANSSILIATLLGLFAWKEYASAEPKARTFLILVVVLLAVGLVAMSVAQTMPASA